MTTTRLILSDELLNSMGLDTVEIFSWKVFVSWFLVFIVSITIAAIIFLSGPPSIEPGRINFAGRILTFTFTGIVISVFPALAAIIYHLWYAAIRLATGTPHSVMGWYPKLRPMKFYVIVALLISSSASIFYSYHKVPTTSPTYHVSLR